MARRSAGILVYRSQGPRLEVLLGHPGGPFWSRRDQRAWSILKGEYAEGEDPEAAARREFAEEVHVAMVDPVEGQRFHGEEPGADVATFLARHGVKVTVDRLPSENHSTADVLRRHAVDTDAQMLVMGAYGHGPTRELVFGGATRTVLKHMSTPVLLSH